MKEVNRQGNNRLPDLGTNVYLLRAKWLWVGQRGTGREDPLRGTHPGAGRGWGWGSRPRMTQMTKSQRAETPLEVTSAFRGGGRQVQV